MLWSLWWFKDLTHLLLDFLREEKATTQVQALLSLQWMLFRVISISVSTPLSHGPLSQPCTLSVCNMDVEEGILSHTKEVLHVSPSQWEQEQGVSPCLPQRGWGHDSHCPGPSSVQSCWWPARGPGRRSPAPASCWPPAGAGSRAGGTQRGCQGQGCPLSLWHTQSLLGYTETHTLHLQDAKTTLPAGNSLGKNYSHSVNVK